MNYNWSFDNINKEDIKCVFELGSRDCLDSITLHQHFNCFVVAFECNPDCIKECNKTLEGKGYPITLVEKAVHEENKYLLFRPFDRKNVEL